MLASVHYVYTGVFFFLDQYQTYPRQLVMSAIVEIKGKNKVDRNEIEFRFETSSFLPSTTVARFVCQQTLLTGKSIETES